jgi:hypothetical protein
MSMYNSKWPLLLSPFEFGITDSLHHDVTAIPQNFTVKKMHTWTEAKRVL